MERKELISRLSRYIDAQNSLVNLEYNRRSIIYQKDSDNKTLNKLKPFMQEDGSADLNIHLTVEQQKSYDENKVIVEEGVGKAYGIAVVWAGVLWWFTKWGSLRWILVGVMVAAVVFWFKQSGRVDNAKNVVRKFERYLSTKSVYSAAEIQEYKDRINAAGPKLSKIASLKKELDENPEIAETEEMLPESMQGAITDDLEGVLDILKEFRADTLTQAINLYRQDQAAAEFREQQLEMERERIEQDKQHQEEVKERLREIERQARQNNK